jgi:hypothetical protein
MPYLSGETRAAGGDAMPEPFLYLALLAAIVIAGSLLVVVAGPKDRRRRWRR